MKQIPLGPYSYLFENEVRQIREAETLGYFFNEVYIPMSRDLERSVKPLGYTVNDELVSKALKTATIFLDGRTVAEDIELVLKVIVTAGEEEKLEIAFTRNRKTIAKEYVFITGNVRADIKSTVNKIVDMLRRKA